MSTAAMLSGASGRTLVDLIQRDFIIAGANIDICSRDERGTFLQLNGSFGGGGGGGEYVPGADTTVNVAERVLSIIF